MGNAEKSSSSSAENPSLLAGRNWFERPAHELYRQTYAEMPGGCEAALAINGGEIARHDSDYNSVSLFDLCLVPTLRRKAPSVAENCLFATGARGRLLPRDFAAFIKRTDKAGAPRNAP
jgi:hypothetical protein